MTEQYTPQFHAQVICLNPDTRMGEDLYLVTSTKDITGAIGYLWGEHIRESRAMSRDCEGPHVVHNLDSDQWYDVVFGETKDSAQLIERPTPT